MRLLKGSGKGWHYQKARHIRAAKTGKAGGTYSRYGTTSKLAIRFMKGKKDVITGKQLRISKATRQAVELDKNKGFGELKREGHPLSKWGDSDKDKVPNAVDCKPLNAEKQGKLHDLYMNVLKKREEKQENKRLAEMKKLEDLKLRLQQANISEEAKNEKIAEKQVIINEIEAEKQKTKALQEQNKQIKEELSKNRIDKKVLRKSKEFLNKPSTKKAIRKGLNSTKKALKGIFK